MFDTWRKARGFFRRRAIEAELREEMQTHLAMKTAADGDANTVRRQFGHVPLLVEDAMDAWGWPRLDGWVRDVRHAFRMMARRKALSITVVSTLAIGIGATSTIFSFVDAVLLRALPFPNSEQLVVVHEMRLSADRLTSRVAPARLEDWQRSTRTFEALAGSDIETFSESTGAVPQRMHIASVSPRFFAVLGTRPLVGRGFVPDEERFGGPKAIVLSERFWRERFAGAETAIGQTLRLEGRGFVVVGVMPRHVEWPNPVIDAWIPTQADDDLMHERGASARFYDTIGRLKAGVAIAQAESDLDGVQRILGRTYPQTDAGWAVTISPLKETIVEAVRPTLWLLFASVGVLLLIACANVGCLLLAQLDSRREEWATRCALGAGRGAMTRQLFAEGLGYAACGGAGGVLLANASVTVVRRRLTNLPRVDEIAVDVRVLAFVAVVSIVAALVFSLAPMLRAGSQNSSYLVVRSGRGIGGQHHVQRLLVSAQIALATVLLVGAGLFLRSLLAIEETPLGFETDHVLALRVTASFSEAPDAVIRRHQDTMTALASLTGIEGVAMSHGLPGTGSVLPVEFRMADEAADLTGAHFARRRYVTADYFRTIRVPIRAGETCRMDPRPDREFEAVVNKAFVDRYLPGLDPVGREIILAPQESSRAVRIVGVAGNAREEGYTKSAEPIVYACGFLRWLPDSDFLIRTSAQPATLTRSVRETIRQIEPGRAVYAVQPLSDALAETLAQRRFRALLVSAFSAIALALAGIGLYGVLTYMVVQRWREFGIRMALGASRTAIAAEILRSGGLLTSAGAIVGLLLAAVATRLLTALIAGVRPSDPITYVSVAAVLLGVALVAHIGPGWRALSIEPVQALRD